MRYWKATLLAATVVVCAKADAQSSLEPRVGRLEQEMRAVQRKVFPEGAGKLLQPQLSPAEETPVPGGSPAGTPIADLTARVTAMEAQLRDITGQVEQNSYRLKQLEQQFADYKATGAAAPAGIGAAVPGATDAPPRPSSPAAAAAVAGDTAAVTPPPASNDARTAAVAAVERPNTGNAAEDAYAYGFRLWQAKFFPEAQTQLKQTLDKYGSAAVGSRTQNLLGRAYLDDGKPALASVAFYENYQKRPDGERATDSLVYLGEALIQLKKLPDACKVYDELNDRYGASVKADLRAMATKGRARAKCGA